jgi:hypothetical protein
VVRDGIEAGLFRDLPPNLVVFGLLGMCNWLHKWYRPDGKRNPEEIADVFVALLEHGYLAPAAGAGPADKTLASIEARLERIEATLRARPARPARRR